MAHEGCTYTFTASARYREIGRNYGVSHPAGAAETLRYSLQETYLACSACDGSRQEYKRFSKAAGLRMQAERAEVAGFGYKQANAADKAYRSYQSTLEKSAESGIMSTSTRHLQNKLCYVWKGEKNFIPQNAKFSKITTIAGKGSDDAIGDIKRLVSDYGGSADEWRKLAGKITSAKYVFDVHWYERDDGIQHDIKLKNRTEKRK